MIFKEIKDENFPKLTNNMKVQAQKERALNRINTNHLYSEAYVSAAKILKDRLAVSFVLKSFGLCVRGSGGMIWKNGTETCIIPYKKRIASPGLMQDTG